MSASSQVLVCACTMARVLPPELVEGTLSLLRDRGLRVTAVDDLCALAARRDPLLEQFASVPSAIVACHPRAVRWLFNAAGAPLALDRTSLIDLRQVTPEQVVAELAGKACTAPAAAGQGEPPAPASPNWLPWFPVIDFERCTHCMQCLGFCLFGVYGVNATRQVEVVAPENCKPNCPACARVCPEAAILFPKHKETSINGTTIPVPAERERHRVDISSVLGGDVYAALRARSGTTQPRFAPDRDPESARLERQRRLAMLDQFDDIPSEVLENLPSMEEIAARAAAARSKAEAALK